LANREIGEAVKYTEISAYSRVELDIYDQWRINQMTEQSALLDALKEGEAKGKAKGKAEGRAEGKAEGRAEGIVEGKAEGRAEGKAERNIEIAKNLYKRHIPISDISDITGLTQEQLSKILK
jgi:predicted transposase YdaD